MSDIQSQILNRGLRYSTVFVEVEKLVGSPAARLFGILRAYGLTKGNKCYIKQVQIEKDFHIDVKKQSGFLKKLEKACLVKTIRNRLGQIKYYQIMEINFHLLCYAPKQYKESLDSGNIFYLETSLKLDEFDNRDITWEILEGAIDWNKIDIKKIVKNIRKMEQKDPLEKEGDLDKNDESSGIKDPLEKEGASNKDRSFVNVKQTPSEFESDSSGAVGTRVKLNRRTVVPKKQNIRSKLKNIVPKTVVKKPAKLKTVEAYYNSRNFVRIKRHWNSLPGLRKIADLTEKQNNTLCNSVLTVKYLLDGSLFKKGMIDIKGNKQNIQLPKDFNLEDHEINISWLLERISQFHKIVTDTKLLPRNKDYLRKQSLGDFILGANGRSDRGTSLLFEYCCGQVKTVQEDPNPKLTKQICHQYNLYTEQDRDFTGSDISHFIKLGAKLEEFAKTPDAKRSPVMGRGNPSRIASRFFVAQEQEWRGRILKQTPAYFSGDHAWGVFQKRLEF